ncbi:hypothetical protein EMIHUDRAFT_200931 [Emiliania huxleyi CCMP1516]|uniref:Uncharacterized protein n=2 Tax=Emiliania huxleyi TaxID=2903 RepID=A0A0D3KLV4_EMIH1|nr:hypothetical protein EMIHUDRAFT_200931 [Emiliania huxleyi CCMP1516]EOD36739.1 hypothetical protein EMIHUDRAFT_200931 [Emiliania huxleyi CCMP1516]|eukprot:XP_005789168.1 hypothetical protein EMIHUDRAFT_200931 [Emiliania huxleyi CCMP1516]
MMPALGSPSDASRVGRRAPTPTITADRRLARPCGEQKFGSLRACRMLCDVWTLARNARKLAFHPWARGRTAVVGSLCDAPIGSSTSSPATSQHGSSLDGSLLSMLLAFCPHGELLDGSLLSTPWTVTSASLLLLQPPPGPASAASLRQHFSSLLLADSSPPRMIDDYPSSGDSSLFGANVYYRGTVALGRTGMIPAAHVYEGGLRKGRERSHSNGWESF